jgi:pimeloyl-ACP methyl ester carboxylesterase
MQCKVRDLDIYYEESGVGRPLLLLHGMPLDHRYILNDMEPVFEDRKGWRRIYPDLPGMGKTRAADWITRQDHMLDIILDFIDVVAPGERFAVAGSSYGGYMARGVVHHRFDQVDGLMINVPSITQDRQKRVLPKHQVVREDADFLAALQPTEQDLRDMVVAQSPALLDVFRRVVFPAVAIADQQFLDRLDLNFSFSFDVDSLPQPFPAPALILTGRFDSSVGYHGAYQLLDSYPRATFVVLDRAGHALPIEQPVLFRALVNEWLDRMEEYAMMNAHLPG